jgi:hypothetical protein
LLLKIYFSILFTGSLWKKWKDINYVC